MRIRPLLLACLATPWLIAPAVPSAEPTPSSPKPLTGADWDRAARQQARKEATSPASAAAIERTRNNDPDAAPSEQIDVFGVDDGKPKRGESQRRDGGPVTWIDGECFYAAPPSMFEPGAATRLWLPTCKPGSPRVLSVGRTRKPAGPVVDSAEEPKALVPPVIERAPPPLPKDAADASAANVP